MVDTIRHLIIIMLPNFFHRTVIPWASLVKSLKTFQNYCSPRMRHHFAAFLCCMPKIILLSQGPPCAMPGIIKGRKQQKDEFHTVWITEFVPHLRDFFPNYPSYSFGFFKNLTIITLSTQNITNRSAYFRITDARRKRLIELKKNIHLNQNQYYYLLFRKKFLNNNHPPNDHHIYQSYSIVKDSNADLTVGNWNSKKDP